MKLPSDNKIEKSVLSVLFNQEYVEGDDMLDADCFHDPQNKSLFSLIMAENRPLDLVTFTTQMHQAGVDNLGENGGAALIAEVFSYQPVTSYFKKHVRILIDLKARRMAMSAACDIIERAGDVTDQNYLESCSEPVMRVHEVATATTKARSKKDILVSVMERYESRLKGHSADGYQTSLHKLNKALGGLGTPRMIVISGRPSSGKTLLAGQLICDVAMQGVPSLFLSCEMPADQISERLIATTADLEPEELKNPIQYAKDNGMATASKEQLLKIKKAVRALNDCPLEFEEPTAPRIGQICTMIRRHHMKYATRIVCIDYIQLVRGSNNQNKEQEITEISHALQGIAKELDLCILALSQENQNGDTKYASTITEDADAVLSIVQDLNKQSETYKKVLGVLINKDRHNGNGGKTLPIEPHPKYLKFVEVDHNQEEPKKQKWGS